MAGPVPMNSLLMCNKGAAPTPLTVVPVDTVMGDGIFATVMDFTPMKNIIPFGVCQELTKAASGVPTPCVPAPTGPWSPGAKVVKIGNFAAMTDEDTISCGIGGTIEVQQSMQVSCDIAIE